MQACKVLFTFLRYQSTRNIIRPSVVRTLQAMIAAKARRLSWYERGGKRTGTGEGRSVTVDSAIFKFWSCKGRFSMIESNVDAV